MKQDEKKVKEVNKKDYIPPVLRVESIEMEYGIAAGSSGVTVPVDPNGNTSGIETTWDSESQTIEGNL